MSRQYFMVCRKIWVLRELSVLGGCYKEMQFQWKTSHLFNFTQLKTITSNGSSVSPKTPNVFQCSNNFKTKFIYPFTQTLFVHWSTFIDGFSVGNVFCSSPSKYLEREYCWGHPQYMWESEIYKIRSGI